MQTSILLVLGLSLLQLHCGFKQKPAIYEKPEVVAIKPIQNPHAVREPISDMQLTWRVEDVLRLSRSFDGVNASVVGGVVHLTGVVDSESGEKELVTALEYLRGIRGVKADLDIAGANVASVPRTPQKQNFSWDLIRTLAFAVAVFMLLMLTGRPEVRRAKSTV